MAFEPFIKSDTGFLRSIKPNNNLLIKSNTGTIVNGWAGQTANTYSAGRAALKVNDQEVYTIFSTTSLANMAQYERHVICGFNVYDDNGTFLNQQIRFVTDKRTTGTTFFMNMYAVLWDVINDVEISATPNLNQTNRRPSSGNPYEVAFAFIAGATDIYFGPVVLFDTSPGPSGYNYICGSSNYPGGATGLISLSNAGGLLSSDKHINVKIINDPNEQDPDGPSLPGGGGGNYDPSSDIVDVPSLAGLNGLASINAGFVTLYKVTMAELQLLASYLYTDNIWQMISNYFSRPADMVAGLLLVPVNVPTGASYKPKVGLHTFNIWLPIVATQYLTKDCGSLDIAEYYGSAWDYNPFSSISIYLPFIGVRELNVDEIMGTIIHVVYHIDVMNGDCIAFITIGSQDQSSHTVRYQFTGNCAQQVPISAENMDAVIQNAVSFATVAVASIATAGAAGAAAGTAAGAAAEAGAITAEEAATFASSAAATANTKAMGDIGMAALNAVMGSKSSVERAGSLGGSSAMMAVLKPFIIRTIPRQSLPDNYRIYEGYPANITAQIGSLSGYTIMETVRLQGIAATDGELSEIEGLLKSGVIV